MPDETDAFWVYAVALAAAFLLSWPLLLMFLHGSDRGRRRFKMRRRRW